MNAAIVPNLTRERAATVVRKICTELKTLGIDFSFDSALKKELGDIKGAEFCNTHELLSACDFVIAVGGDGSVIRAAKDAAKYNKKLLGINAGRLAYLCDLDEDEIYMLSALKNKEYTIKKRMLLEVEHYRNGEKIFGDICVNDIVFARGHDIRLVALSVKADGRPIGEYIADGLIFATPTGSTAYSMSAGGPIAEPSLEAVVLTPVCPHSLVCRPYIFDAHSEFEICCKDNGRKNNVYFSCDGAAAHELFADSFVKVKKASVSACFISIKSDNFIEVLNKKLEIKK